MPTEPQTLAGVLHAAADPAAHPDRLALVEGDVRLSYRELARQALAFAASLRRLGVQQGDVVTVQLPNWWETQVVVFGTILAGAVCNPVVPIYRERELGFVVRQARPRVLVVPQTHRGHDHLATASQVAAGPAEPPAVLVVRPTGEVPPGVATFPGPGPGPGDGAGSWEPPGLSADPDAVALLLYTSGSTADPKGALHSSRTLLHETRQVARLARLGGSDAVFMASPVTHITGFLFGTLLPALLGVPVVLQDRWNASHAVDLVEEHGCTFTVSATTFLLGLTEEYERRRSRSSLRVFVCGGAEIGPALVRRARSVMGTRVVRTYGSTELPTFSIGDPYGDPDIAAETDGVPVPLASWRLDTSEGRDAGGGGELLVKGAELFLGYLDPALDEAAFDADGFFRTGDLVRFDDRGALTVIGRQKDVIIRGGENLSAIEMEDHLQEHPAVAQVAVVAMPDPVLGERACAFVVPTGEGRVDVAELGRFLRLRGLAVQKSPERVELVDELPRTASGKVQKYLLREMVRDRLAAEGTPVERDR